MSYPKEWKPGKADEVWKVMICARDASSADQLIASLVYLLTDAGTDEDRGIDLIRSMSGDQIIDAILAYKQKSYQSVKNAMKSERAA